jgi:hypothetical protein
MLRQQCKNFRIVLLMSRNWNKKRIQIKQIKIQNLPNQKPPEINYPQPTKVQPNILQKIFRRKKIKAFN